ncbi:alternative ribosome rescue aminoacyl-tRNA hydrolase ArfB [Oryzibacter oryziterrae]|uniref:alternative ribosome rescue aminoacyl-tRNA hydrolase ArfB n=1 Tax=Oryzibacter oryziterrae TaxID=2766474 RepID=UPI001F01F200|nr:alternative ribosome rescue aminoacyl-tRNA hydrolase ArfB [Oryzibacter oryziterrae]
MIEIAPHIHLDEREISESFIQASGPGGQNVNKVASAVLLRYDLLNASGIPWEVKVRASRIAGSRLTQAGEIVIQAQRHRTQERNRADALERLIGILKAAVEPPRPRIATRPTRASQVRRVDAKSRRGAVKKDRRSPGMDD